MPSVSKKQQRFFGIIYMGNEDNIILLSEIFDELNKKYRNICDNPNTLESIKRLVGKY